VQSSAIPPWNHDDYVIARTVPPAFLSTVNTYKVMSMITVDPKIAAILRSLLQFPSGVQLYCPSLTNSSHVVRELADMEAKITTISSDRDLLNKITEEKLSTSVRGVTTNDYQLYQERDKFHLAFSVFDYDLAGLTKLEKDLNQDARCLQRAFALEREEQTQLIKPQLIKDKLLIWNCSKSSDEREAENHLMGLESLMTSVMVGGYFASVVPKNWAGRHMKYLTWWRENAAVVAKIRLPESAVRWQYPRRTSSKDYLYGNKNFDIKPYDRHSGTTELQAPGEWDLIIWFRPRDKSGAQDTDLPRSSKQGALLDWAEYRWNQFNFTLESLSDEAIDTCSKSFKRSEWWLNSVRAWKKMLQENDYSHWCGTTNKSPHGLREPEDTWFFETTDSNRLAINVIEDVADIKSMPHAIHIKPTNSKIKLMSYNAASRGALQDIRISLGFEYHKEKDCLVSNFDMKHLYGNLVDVRESLTNAISRAGMIPVMTASDHHLMKKRARWLNIQLTPMTRLVPIKGTSEIDQTEETKWETLYEDMDLNAVFPEIMDMWRARAIKMKMHLASNMYKFQFEDVIEHAAKQSLLNGNVMGLGKTREMLFAAILRGAENTLIVCPSKLVGTWQDEIEGTIIPYARTTRKHWSGKKLDVTAPNIIQFAEDCLPANLKTFNIITFDKLKDTPRDGRFYKCPKCEDVTYSAYKHEQECVKCTSSDFDEWSAHSTERDELGRLKRQKFKVHTKTMKRVHWDPSHITRKDIPEYECELTDTRFTNKFSTGKPVPTKMVEQKQMHKKMVPCQIGYDVHKDPLTGEETQTPKYSVKPRKAHVKWTFSEVIRWTFNHVIVDEILYAKNEDALRTKALNHLCGRTRYGATGTPLKGMPQSIVGYLNWIFDRQVYPDYRKYTGGLGAFLKKFKTEVMIDAVQLPNGDMIGGKPKQIPKINNAELFQAELSPLMRRSVRNQPNVLCDIPMIQQVAIDESVEMDDEHKAYYNKWLQFFSDWWQKMKEEEEGKGVKPGELMTKLGYLIGASTVPHLMLAGIAKSKDKEMRQWATMIDTYKGPLTQKMIRTQELVKEQVALENKVIMFARRTGVLKLQKRWADINKIPSMIIEGSVTNEIAKGQTRSKRHRMVQSFRNDNYSVMWAGLACLAEGLNIPEANYGIIQDYSWEPSDSMQGIARMLRPSQKKVVTSHFLMHKGSIDEYMCALCYLKGRSHSEGIDYMEFADCSVSMIPDIRQYADSIVDGTDDVLKRNMWLAVDNIKKRMEDGEEETV